MKKINCLSWVNLAQNWVQIKFPKNKRKIRNLKINLSCPTDIDILINQQIKGLKML